MPAPADSTSARHASGHQAARAISTTIARPVLLVTGTIGDCGTLGLYGFVDRSCEAIRQVTQPDNESTEPASHLPQGIDGMTGCQ